MFHKFHKSFPYYIVYFIIPFIMLAQFSAISMAQEQSAGQINQDDQPAEKDEKYLLEMFGKLIPKLESALELKEMHEKLPNRTFFYGKDKRENQKEINALLDQAIQILDVSEVNQQRSKIQELKDKIKTARIDMAKYREQRLAAPYHNDMGTLGKFNPLNKTKEDYDELIKQEEQKIKEYQEQINDIKESFRKKLQKFGISVSQEALDSLMSSVVADDFIQMANVFDNLKEVTLQLQRLTEQSNESLEIAKRYYGMYVVLIEILDRIQDSFIETIETNYIPKLDGYIKDAQNNIEEAKNLIAKDETNTETLQNNIESNRLTMEAARYYKAYLESQAEMIEMENRELEKNIAVAKNTYKTVRVSSNVAELIQNGRKNFDSLMKLKMPELRGFQNKVMQQEFQRLTDEIRSY